MESKSANLLSLINIIDVDVCSTLLILATLSHCEKLSINSHSHAGKLDTRAAEHGLLTSLRVLDYQLVVQGEIGESLLRVPHQVVMDPSISVVPSDQLLFKDISLALDSHFVLEILFNNLATSEEMSVCQLSVISDLSDNIWRWDEVLLIVLHRGLLHWLE